MNNLKIKPFKTDHSGIGIRKYQIAGVVKWEVYHWWRVTELDCRSESISPLFETQEEARNYLAA